MGILPFYMTNITAWGIIMKIGKNIMFVLAGMMIFFSLIANRSTVRAQEIGGTLLELDKAVQVKESEDDNAAVLTELEKGTPVIAIEEGKNNTLKIKYQEYTGYIPKSAVSIYGEEEFETIVQEQKEEEAVNFRVMEEYETEQKDKKGSLLFGGLIALFVIVIFGVGIVAALKQEKKKDE